MELKRRAEIPGYHAPGRERLAEMARFLESLPHGKLTFAQWYGHGRGCAVGLAARDPWFMAQGLGLEAPDSLKDCRPVFGGRCDWSAVTAFFAISEAEAKALFTRNGYDGEVTPDPSRVAAKIRRHLSLAGTPALTA
ncbi:MAG: hypothetical protein AAF495_13300 [Pseudomonadota bacterium]